MSYKVALISLGCAKNLVNSEQMLSLLIDAGHEIVPDPEGADAVVINTCGFIESAQSEAISNILEMAELKSQGLLGKIIVTGCLTERHREQVMAELPEVDAVLGTGSYGEIVRTLEETMTGGRPSYFGDINGPVDEFGRVVTTGPNWAYIRIAEGCDNRCAYCVIPSLRGKYRSRRMEDVLSEAQALADSGVKELIVVAQDITRYGTDLYGARRLSKLLLLLCGMSFSWIRLHYLYPEEIDDELIDIIASEHKIVKYLDIPIQHINDGILRRMNRRGTGAEIRALFTKLRARIPGLVLRTSLITGLPGEGEAEFEELCEFLREYRIERAGVFPYSPEDGTPAAAMPDRCSTEEAQRRAELIMELQDGIMDEFSRSFIGRELQVLVMGEDGETGLMWGRTFADSPDIDGRVLLNGTAEPGKLVWAEVTGIVDGDLTATVSE